MEPPSQNRREAATATTTATARELSSDPRPWVRHTIAILLRLGLGVSLLNGGLLGYVIARRGGTSAGLGWTTLLGPAAVAGVLENDLLVPFVQIVLGLVLVLGFFTEISTILAGMLILSAPIFQFLAILSSSTPADNSTLIMQALVTTGSINLLVLVAAVLWLTPIEGTPWSLDFLIFSHRRTARHVEPAPPPVAGGAPAAGEQAPLIATRGG